jgi:hypothetical protein
VSLLLALLSFAACVAGGVWLVGALPDRGGGEEAPAAEGVLFCAAVSLWRDYGSLGDVVLKDSHWVIRVSRWGVRAQGFLPGAVLCRASGVARPRCGTAWSFDARWPNGL